MCLFVPKEWCIILHDFEKRHVWEKCGSSVTALSAFIQLGCNILKKVISDILDFLHEDNHQGKVTSLFTTFGGQFCLSFRLEDSLILNISGKKSNNVLVFLHEVSCQGKLAFETTFLCWVQPIVPLAQSHYRIFYDHYHWKVSIDIWGFSYGDAHQGKVVSEITFVSCMLSSVPLIQSNCRIL